MPLAFGCPALWVVMSALHAGRVLAHNLTYSQFLSEARKRAPLIVFAGEVDAIGGPPPP